MGAQAGGQSAGPDGGHRPPLCSRLQKTEARRDAQLFLAAAQTLGRPIKLHQMDAFLRGDTVGLGPSSSAQGPGSNKRDQRVRHSRYHDSAHPKLDSASVTIRMEKKGGLPVGGKDPHRHGKRARSKASAGIKLHKCSDKKSLTAREGDGG